MYSSHLWSSFKICTLHKLRVAYNNYLRRLMSIPKFCSASQMFVYFDVRSFGEIRQKMVFNFIDRLKKSDNGLIKSAHTMCFYSNLQTNIGGVFYIQISNFLCCLFNHLFAINSSQYLQCNIVSVCLVCLYTLYTHLFNDL